MLRKIPRSFIFMVILLGVATIFFAVFDHFLCNYLHRKLDGTVYGGVCLAIERKGVHIDPLRGGLRLNGMRVLRHPGREILSEFSDIFLRVNYRSLIMGKPELERLEFYGIDSSIEGILKTFSDIFLSTDSDEKKTITSRQTSLLTDFDYLTFLPPEVIFRGVVFNDLQDYLVSENLDLAGVLNPGMINGLSFAGVVCPQDDGLVKIEARPFVSSEQFSASSIPVSAVLSFTPSLGKGLFNLSVTGLSVEQFLNDGEVKMNGGSLTLNTEGEFLFAEPGLADAENFDILPMSENLNFYYRIDGEGRIFSPYFASYGLELHEIYLKFFWDANCIRLENGQADFLGGGLLFEGYLNKDDKRLQVKAESLQVARLIDLFSGVEGLRSEEKSDWGGTMSTELNFDGKNKAWEFSPIKIANLSFYGITIPLDSLEIKGLSAMSTLSTTDLQLTIYPHEALREELGVFYVNSVNGGLSLKKQLHNVSLVALEKQMDFSALPVSGLLQAEISGGFKFSDREWFLNIDGLLQKVDLGGFPAEGVKFLFQSANSSASLSGEITLPLADGRLGFIKDFYVSDRGIELFLHAVELSYPAYKIRNYPVSGQCSGNVSIALFPEFSMHLNLDLLRLVLPGASFAGGSLSGRVSNGDFALDFEHEEGKIGAKGQLNLAVLAEISGDAEISLSDILPGFSFEIREDRLERLSALAAYKSLGFSGGSAVVSADFSGAGATGAVRELILNVGGTQWELKKPFTWKWQKPYSVDFNAVLQRKEKQRKGNFSIQAKGEDYQLSFAEADLGLLVDYMGFDGLKARGSVQAGITVTGLFSEPEMRVVFQATDAGIEYEGRETVLERISGVILLGDGFLELEKVEIVQKKDVFVVRGKVPCVFAPVSGGFEFLKSAPMELSLRLPETPLAFVKDFFPSYVKEIYGYFKADLQVAGSIEAPVLSGGAGLSLSALELEYGNGGLGLRNVQMGLSFEKSVIIINELSGEWDDGGFKMSGRAVLPPDFSWELSGELYKKEFTDKWLILKKPRIRNIVAGGRRRGLSFIGTLVAESGVLVYEPLLEWLNKGRTFSLDWLSSYDIHLRIEDFKKAEMRADFFRMDLRPDIAVQIRPYGVVVEGMVNISGGYMDIVRNRFQVIPDSYIRFVSYDDEVGSGGGRQRQRGNDIWGSEEFLRGGLGRKLSLLWEHDNRRGGGFSLERPGEGRLFDTRLRINARSRVRNSDISLILSGSVDKLDYSLQSDDKTMSSEDIMRELASRGVGGSGSGRGETRSQSPDDAELISRQFTAQLEDKFLGRHFEDLLSSMLNLSEFRLQPNLTGENRNLLNLRMGASLSDDVYLSHEQEGSGDFVKSSTRLKYRLDDQLDLFWQKDRRFDYKFDLGIDDNEDVQFGFERKFRF